VKRYPISVKLCRFELKSEPGTIRSGMVYDGKIYETDGTEAIGVHEAADVRPLAPVPTPPSIRVFRTDLSESGFVYANPAAVIGPSMVIELPDTATDYVVRSFLGAVIGGAGYQLGEEEAEAVLLGFTLVNILSSNSIEEDDGKCVGRSQDFGIMVGTVITACVIFSPSFDSASAFNFAKIKDDTSSGENDFFSPFTSTSTCASPFFAATTL